MEISQLHQVCCSRGTSVDTVNSYVSVTFWEHWKSTSWNGFKDLTSCSTQTICPICPAISWQVQNTQPSQSITWLILTKLNRTTTQQQQQKPKQYKTRSQAVARIADRTAKNCRGHMTWATPTFRGNFSAPACHSPYEAVYRIWSL